MPKWKQTGSYNVKTFRQTKSFGDYVKEGAQIAAGAVVIMVIVYLLLSQ